MAESRPIQALRFGARPLAGDQALFRIWAPDVTSMGLEVEDAPAVAMARVADGFFEARLACRVGARYRYRLPDGTAIPDPASRAQDGDVHDRSILVDPHAFVWQYPEWPGRAWHETVLYELHVGLFGGFAGVIAELPRIAALGVTAIELMPIADFPGPRNWGYDGVLPFAPDASYGSPDALRALVDAAHGLGLSVFLDVVYNHFGPEGNYLSLFAAPFFRHDLATPWGAALDFREPEVRAFFTENVLYWLDEFRLDGLRFDAVHAIADAGWLDSLPGEVGARFDGVRPIHLVVENDDNEARLIGAGFAAQWNDDVHHVLHVLLTDEFEGYYADYADDPAGRLARCLSEGFAYQGEASPHREGSPRGTPSAHLPPTAFVAFLQNHDQVGNRALGERLVHLTDPAALSAAMALLLLAPWVPMLFMGEPENSREPFLYFTSYEGELAQAVREGRRREFARFREFGSDPAQSRIPDPNALATFEQSRLRLAAAHTRSDEPMPALVRTLLGIRRDALMPYLGHVRSLAAASVGPKAVWACWQMRDDRRLSIYTNLSAHGVRLDTGLRPAHPGALLFESRPGGAAQLVGGDLSGYTTIALLAPAAESRTPEVFDGVP